MKLIGSPYYFQNLQSLPMISKSIYFVYFLEYSLLSVPVSTNLFILDLEGL